MLPAFQRLLASFPRPGDPLGYQGTWREAAVRRGLLPVFHTWEIGYAVDRTGEPYGSADDRWLDPAPLEDARTRHVVLAQAAAAYPELASLRPRRTPGDSVCPACEGRGGIPAYPAIICECGNLGWVPAA